MGMVYGRLKIELMSDLCAGSGYSYAGVIDSDVSYDAYGIPVIPARRIKGCMREAAELVCPEAAEELFGRTGDTGTRGLILGNAYIEDYKAITEELSALRSTNRREADYLSPQNILKRYTGIRGQTKLQEDTKTAEENSLRYTRVVGQYDPRKEKESLCFYAEIAYDGARQKELERIVKAVRNLGMNRNRGLGSVRCTLVDIREAGTAFHASANESVMKSGVSVNDNEAGKREQTAARKEGEGRVCLTYIFHNEEPLLMSSDNTGASDSYISGRSILGALAGAYLGREGTKAESEEFRQLFLDGSTIFTNANITFLPEEGKEYAARWPGYVPAPLYLNSLKKTKVLVNLLGEERRLSAEEEKEYDTEGGNLPKKLKTHYVYEAAPNTFDVAEPERELVYHNSQKELLYSLEVLTEGQYFRGRIYTEWKYVPLLKELLEKTRLSFGKSKTAQYGSCELAAEVTVEDAAAAAICVEEGQKAAVVLASDSVFLDEAAGYTVRFEKVKELIGEQLGIPYDKEVDEGSMLQTCELTGYHTVWNLRRPGVPAVKAGSVLVYTIPAGKRWQGALYPDAAFVGERNAEGYGEVRIAKCQHMTYAARRMKALDKTTGESLELKVSREFLVSILTEQLLERMVFLYTKSGAKLNLTPATVGRLDLMLQESLNEYREEPKRAFADFCARVASIKRAKENKEASDFLSRILLKSGAGEGNSELDLQKMTADREDSRLMEIKELLARHTTKEEYEKRLTGIWGVYMEKILTYHKYLKKHEGGRKNGEE